MEEANEEAEHKGWCDTELSTNEQTRKEKTAAVETLHAEIDELSASIAKLTQEITDLTAEIAAIDKAVAEATEIREAEKAENTQTIKDSQEAQTAVSQAVTVLKEFYEKAGEATALIQSNKQKPEIFDEPYTGMQSENGGVLGMLEVIASDFARTRWGAGADTFAEFEIMFHCSSFGSKQTRVCSRSTETRSEFRRGLETDTKAAEAEAQSAFDKFSSESAVNRAANSKDVEHKTTKKTNQESALTAKKADLEGTQKELDAALAYYDKLKPSCVDAGVSYEDRVARRKEEIEYPSVFISFWIDLSHFTRDFELRSCLSLLEHQTTSQ